jgi:hypothetical protein
MIEAEIRRLGKLLQDMKGFDSKAAKVRVPAKAKQPAAFHTWFSRHTMS